MKQVPLWPLALSTVAAISGCYENFSDPIRITPEADSDITAGPVAVAPNDDVYILYSAIYDGRTKIAVRKSTDNGQSWNSWYEVDDDICCQSANLMTLYADQDIAGYLYATYGYGAGSDTEFKRSTNGGQTWTSTYLLDEYNGIYDAREIRDIRIAQNPNTGTLVIGYLDYYESWLGYNPNEIEILRSTNRAFTWNPPVNAVTWNCPDGDCDAALLGLQYMDDGTLVMVYGEYYDGDWPYIYARRSTNDGVSWGAPIQVNTTVSGSARPKGHIVKTGTRLHAVWMTNANTKHSYSDDNGLTWTPNELLDWDGDHTNPWLTAAPSGAVVLSWLDGVTNQYNDIFYREFGSQWSSTRRVNNQLHTMKSSGFYGNSINMAADSENRIFSAWADSRYHPDDWTGDPELVVAISDPNLAVDVGVQLNDNSVFSQVQRGDAIGFSYELVNAGDSPETVDVWVTYKGLSNPISGTLQTDYNVSIDANTSTTLTYSGAVHPATPYQEYEIAVHVGNAHNDNWDEDIFVAECIP